MMSENTRKVFISYSWAVQDRVVELAERLVANGVDVVLDVWDLMPGHDKYAFMEQSVNDQTVNKVLIICDKTYTEKADARQGGVGDETVIISPEIYGKVRQEIFTCSGICIGFKSHGIHRLSWFKNIILRFLPLYKHIIQLCYHLRIAALVHLSTFFTNLANFTFSSSG